MKRILLVVGGTVALVGLALLALGLTTGIFETRVNLAVDNRSAEQVTVSVGDDGIGCGGSGSVAPGAYEELSIRMGGTPGLCSFGAEPYTMFVEGEDEALGTCFGSTRNITVAEDLEVECEDKGGKSTTHDPIRSSPVDACATQVAAHRTATSASTYTQDDLDGEVIACAVPLDTPVP